MFGLEDLTCWLAAGAVTMDAPGGQPADDGDDGFADFAVAAKAGKGQDADTALHEDKSDGSDARTKSIKSHGNMPLSLICFADGYLYWTCRGTSALPLIHFCAGEESPADDFASFPAEPAQSSKGQGAASKG